MTFVLELKAEIEEVLQRKARDNGFEANVYLEKMIEKDIEHSKTLDEILAPLRKEFDESGMTEDELDEFIEEIREEVYQEKLRNR